MRQCTINNSNIDKIIKTHVSTLFFVENTVYKIKNEVSLAPYISYINIDERKKAIYREYQRGKKFSFDIYQDICLINIECLLAGEPSLQMRRFDSNEITVYDWLNNNTSISGPSCELMFHQILKFHDKMGISTCGYTEALSGIEKIFSSIISEANLNNFETNLTSKLHKYFNDFISKKYKKALVSRIESGNIKELHGDLHSGNVLISNGNLVPFDFLDFPEKYIYGDVLIDNGFFIIDFIVKSSKNFELIIEKALKVFKIDRGMLLPFLVLASMIRAITYNHSKNFDVSRQYLLVLTDLLMKK